MPHGSGDFIIFATCLFHEEPIVIVKPSICEKGRQEDNEYLVQKVFLDDEDKCLDKGEYNIIMVWNGLCEVLRLGYGCSAWRALGTAKTVTGVP